MDVPEFEKPLDSTPPESGIFTYASQEIPAPSEQASPNSVAAAASFLSRTACAIRAASPDRSRHSAEFEALLCYAEENGLDFPAENIPQEPLAEGQEHAVWPFEDRTRVFKATKPNKFGLVAGPNPDATPGEYFDRLTLSNAVFGDDVRLEGIAKCEGRIRVVTSQRVIIGAVCESWEIILFMQDMGFIDIEVFGQICWYRREDNVLAFDAHTRNFFTTPDGVVPIDVNVIRPSGDMKDEILACL